MISIFSIFLQLWLALTAEAKPYQLGCMTEHPSTTFVIQEKEDFMEALIVHHHGSAFAPVLNGIALYRDLPIIMEQSKSVLKMKREMTFRWPMKKCKIRDEIKFECFGSDDVQEGLDGAKLKPFALYTGKITDDTFVGKWDSVSIRFSFSTDTGESSAVDMKYPMEGCFKPKNRPELMKKLGLFIR
jgi:hypothetical protein